MLLKTQFDQIKGDIFQWWFSQPIVNNLNLFIVFDREQKKSKTYFSISELDPLNSTILIFLETIKPLLLNIFYN